MQKILGFGENVAGYDVPVLNEREIRAAAGLLFLAAFFSFMHVWLVGNYFFIKLYVSGFLVEFIIRLFINPKFAPAMILGRFIVSQQKVEYTGAPQKKFAWSIGFLMALGMFASLVLANQVSVVTCIVCLICLTFLFFETSFGICIGCVMYNLTHKQKAHFCPGGVCEVHQQEPIQVITPKQILLVIMFAIGLWLWAKSPLVVNSISRTTGQDCLIHQLTGQTDQEVNSCAPVMHTQR